MEYYYICFKILEKKQNILQVKNKLAVTTLRLKLEISQLQIADNRTRILLL